MACPSSLEDNDMGPFLAALGYAWISHGCAFLLMPWSVDLTSRLRAVVLWAFAALLLFALQDWFIALLLVTVAVALLAPVDPVQRAAFFLVAVPCLPTYVTAPLPLPGVNVLMDLTQYKLASAVLLLPLFAMRRYGTLRRSKLSMLEACLLFYIVYTAIIVGISLNATTALRHLADMTLLLMLPFYVLRRVVKRIQDLEIFFTMFLVASIVLVSITLVSTAKQWDFYRLVQPVTVLSIPDFRSGFVRIQAVANPHSLAFHLAAALMMLEFLKLRMNLKWIYLMTLRFAFVAGIFFTNAFGAMLSLAVAAIFYLLFLIRSTPIRTLLLLWIAIQGVAGGIWLLYGSAEPIDVYGTFNYRQELFRIGSAYVLQHPIFGDYDFYKNPLFEPLRQGQGIIDITNFYLQVLLHYGFLGAVPFFTVMVAPIVALLRQSYKMNVGSSGARGGSGSARQGYGRASRRGAEANPPATSDADQFASNWRRMAAILFGLQIGWLVFVATSSDVGLTVHFGIVFAALGRGLADLGAEVTSKSDAIAKREAMATARSTLYSTRPSN